VKLLARRLTDAGKPFRQLREPGGTKLGEAMRATLLAPSTRACPTAELFGYLQARAQLCVEVIAPALAAKGIVLLDRFYHSTIAYQGFGLGLDLQAIRAAISLAIGSVRPDLVFWLNLDPAEAQRRRSVDGRAEDRIESRGLDYMQKVHNGFQQLVKAGEMIELDARLPESELAATVWKRVEALI
jgi:dTMP kinase